MVYSITTLVRTLSAADFERLDDDMTLDTLYEIAEGRGHEIADNGDVAAGRAARCCGSAVCARECPRLINGMIQPMPLAGRDRRDKMDRTYRIFRGGETKQIDGVTSRKANPEAWYYEPADYEGDVLWSRAFATEDEARAAAASE